MTDSLRKGEAIQQINELNKRFEIDELRAQQEREKMESKRRQTNLVMAIIVIVLIAIVIFVLSRLQAARRLAGLKAEQERIESELRIARDIQMSMVPHEFPQREGLDMYASMSPAREVGGDLYGYVDNGDQLYFCLGDVSGKGVPASLFMSQATRLFQTLAKQGLQPAEICTRINNALSGDDNQNGMFVTCFVGLIDLNSGHLSFCNAGHNPPVIGGSESHGDFLEMEANPPFGLWSGVEYIGEEIDTIQGHPLFVYTDGLNEAENQEQEQFGNEHLLSILRNTHFESSRQVVETMAAEVETHRNGAEPNDDLTMMCIRVTKK
jgi:serine phosphatase RsbU (regulator of sigma subunit)